MNRFTPFFLALVLAGAPVRGNAQAEQTDPLILAGRYDEALAIYAKALETDPKSVRLHLLRFDLLDKTGRLLEARTDIEAAFASDSNNIDVLKRYTRTMDVFGNHAGAAYSQLAAALRAAKAPDTDIRQALDRGRVVALRDGETAAAESIEAELGRMDGRPVISRVPAESTGEERASVPGGIHALALAASMKSDVSPELFALQYSQAIAARAEGSEVFKTFVSGIHLYFQTIESLKRHGTVTPGGLDILLDLRDPSNATNVQEVMRLMGWRVILTEDRVLHGVFHLTIELGTEKDDALRQVFSSGFGIDFFAVKDALENVHAFRLRIPYETIPIALSEKFWLDQVIGGKQSPSGLFEGLADHAPAAHLYVALASVNNETRQLLLQNLSANQLARQYSDLLSLYGASLSAHGGRLEVPGGQAGVSAWQQLAGVGPESPGPFINALMQKDGGKLLAYFHTLLQLPLANQRFFTRTPERLSAFYNVFPFSAQQIQGHNLIRRDNRFFDLARELPIDAQGNLSFPGGEEIWRGDSQDGASSGSRPKTFVPEAADQTLLSLPGRSYQTGATEHDESENFIEIVRLQKVWHSAMDSQSVVLLDRNYAKYRALYPYLFSLPALDTAELEAFFKAADGIDSLLRIDRTKLNSVLGEFHGVLSLLAILHETGGLPDRDAKLTLTAFCRGLSSITGDGQRVRQLREYTMVTLSALYKIVTAVGFQAPVADDRLAGAMSGASQDIEFQSDQQQWTANRAAWKRQQIRGVLGEQTVTSIQVLLELYRDAVDLINGQPDPAARIQRMELKSAELLEVTARAEDRLSVQNRQRLIQGKPGEIAQSIAKLKTEAARGNLNTLPSLAGQLFEQLTPYVKTTLVAWSYAYYASPEDLVVSGDRYFVRRHQFVGDSSVQVWQETDVQTCGDAAGVCVSGGLAELGVAAGNWGRTKTEASASLHSEGSFDEALRAELTSIRTVPWSRISTVSQHLIALQIRAGKETIVRGSMTSDDSIRQSLTEHLMGLVGNFRRAAIMQSLSDGNPAAALDLLSASDLYFLVESMRQDSKDWRLSGPLFDAFNMAVPDVGLDTRDYFGGSHFQTEGSVRPQLIQLGPCEEYKQLRRKDALWECSGHVLLNIAEAADREGIPADATAILSEMTLRQLGKGVVMADQDDWMSVVRAMNRISLLEVLPELERVRKD